VIIITSFYRNPQVLLTYTGGLCGAFILMIIPMAIVRGARRSEPELRFGPNPYKSKFTSSKSFNFVLVFCIFVLCTVVYQIYEQITGASSVGDKCEGLAPTKVIPAMFYDL